MPHYELHFPALLPLMCTELAMAVGHIPAAANPLPAAAGAAAPAAVAPAAAVAAAADPDGGYDGYTLWNDVAHLRWRAASEGRCVPPAASHAALDAARRLAGHFAAKYPAARGLTLGERMQVVALGRQVADAVGPDPALIDALKKDLQPVDLAQLLDRGSALP